MPTTTPHRIFSIAEILEHILSQTEPQTLLTTAQQVCQTWHTLIQTSTLLQETLFFKPTKAPQQQKPKRTRNPFLATKIWPDLFRKRPHSQPHHHSTNYHYALPPADPTKEDLYLRPEASWRRMLVQQPPTSSIGVFVLDRKWISCDEDLSPVRIFEAEVEYLTLAHLHWSALMGSVLPLERVLVFWDHGDYYLPRERLWTREIQLALSRLLPFLVAENKGSLRGRRHGLGVDWSLGIATGGRRHGYGSNKGAAGRTLVGRVTSSCDRGSKSKLREQWAGADPLHWKGEVTGNQQGPVAGRREKIAATSFYYASSSSRAVGCQKFVWRNTTSGDRFVKQRYNAWNVGMRTKRRTGKTARRYDSWTLA
ncbi:hypothetical protein BDV28DRAFT_160783 [Aspergillus coremiiformis]|uniref:Uncharacterized protein n=1 Tax=Aspergillus coremiiformis TaxID=138285 RepID=A0A5N6YUC6_9EURO|nr:hypothetical protein BDV28DRAFT_160783 [Aspergillus coremiiformis]